jgi:hypothetical protein
MSRWLRWWSQPIKGGYLANGVLPRWSVLTLSLWVGGIEALALGLLPAMGVPWFYDHWRIGGFLPVLAALLLGAYWLDRRFGEPGDGSHSDRAL